ncbi:MAG: hypothetical protein KAT70_05265 [Thermoplasmata archaeon]|nr:hypothetical protein [Thermoplasmata archaeon]
MARIIVVISAIALTIGGIAHAHAASTFEVVSPDGTIKLVEDVRVKETEVMPAEDLTTVRKYYADHEPAETIYTMTEIDREIDRRLRAIADHSAQIAILQAKRPLVETEANKAILWTPPEEVEK